MSLQLQESTPPVKVTTNNVYNMIHNQIKHFFFFFSVMLERLLVETLTFVKLVETGRIQIILDMRYQSLHELMSLPVLVR